MIVFDLKNHHISLLRNIPRSEICNFALIIKELQATSNTSPEKNLSVLMSRLESHLNRICDQNSHHEFITIDEACEASGWAEATLKKRLRGRVPMFGKGSYSRAEFFDYLKRYWKEKQDDNNDNFVEQAAQKAKVLAMSAGGR